MLNFLSAVSVSGLNVVGVSIKGLHQCGTTFCQVNSMTAVYNFTTNYCSKNYPSDCFTFNWHYELLIYGGGQVDTNSNAGYGLYNLNF
jgi:hypothetical protein